MENDRLRQLLDISELQVPNMKDIEEAIIEQEKEQ